MKALVLGLGSIGTRHARNLKSLGVTDVAGMDPAAERRDSFTAEFSAPAYVSLEAALEQPPDLAIVASPNRFHMPQALACARLGIPLLIEKPLSHSRDGVEELAQEAAKRRLFVHVGSNWKFHPAFQTMKRLLEQGDIGRPVGAQVLAGQWLPDWHPWEDYRKGYSARRDLGGGVMLDAHEFDYLTWLLGPVTSIAGFAVRTGALEIETDDVASVSLKFASGALATMQLDYIQREPRRRYHITGTEGTIEWNLQYGRVDLIRAADKTTQSFAVPLGDVNEMYVKQTRHVLDAIAQGLPPVTSLAQAAAVLELQLGLKDRS